GVPLRRRLGAGRPARAGGPAAAPRRPRRPARAAPARALGPEDGAAEPVDARVREPRREPRPLCGIEGDREAEAGDPSGDPAEHVREVVDAEIEPAERDRADESDRRDGDLRATPAPPREERERPVAGGRDHRVSAWERGRVELDEAGLGAGPVE